MSEVSIQILRYESSMKKIWNEFLSESNHDAFIFNRDYMEYHQDRFDDHSLMFYNSKNQLIGLLPAHHQGNQLISHQGLTYGGLIVSRMTMTLMATLLSELREYLKGLAFRQLIYKSTPIIYQRQNTQEDLYCLHVLGSTVLRRQMLSVLTLQQPVCYQSQRFRHIKKALKSGLKIDVSDDLQAYWGTLEENLQQRYNNKPVHTLDEISFLQQRFPEHIKLYVCGQAHQPLAGILIYETKAVVRAQYIASTIEGRELGAMDLLLHHLITTTYANKLFFDLGSSHADEYLGLNVGLVNQKESFGARAVIFDTYQWRV